MKHNKYLFISILITYILVILSIVIYFSFLYNIISIPSCPIYTHFGIYCPACGGTRATIALVNFDLISSINQNPIVIYTLFFSTLYLLVEFFNIFFHKKINIPFKLIVYIGIFILFMNFIIKNIFLFI